MRGDAGEPGKRRLPRLVIAHDTHVDRRVPKVASHVHRSHGDKPTNPGVLRAFGQKGRDLFPDGLGDAVRTPQFAHMRSSGLGCLIECSRDFFRAVALEHVTDFDIVKVLDADSALETVLDFKHVVLEAAQ